MDLGDPTDFDRYLRALQQIRGSLDSIGAYEAYGELLAFVAAFNAGHAAPELDDSLPERIRKLVPGLHDLLSTIAEALGATSFTVGVGGPVPGLAVSLTFGRG